MPNPPSDGGAQAIHNTTRGYLDNNIDVNVIAINPSRNFIDVKTSIVIKEKKIKVKFSKKNYNPIMMEWVDTLDEIKIPWWNDKTLIFEFE